jgi:diguanylate cyclase (GGDEF)-like protein
MDKFYKAMLFLHQLHEFVNPYARKIAALEKELCSTRQQKEALERAALYDVQTGLLNEFGCTTQISYLLKTTADANNISRHNRKSDTSKSTSKKMVAILMVDLNGLKKINDRFGHHAGDAAICGVGRVIAETFSRTADVAAHLHGDEFLIAIPCKDETEALAASKMLSDNVLEGCHTTLDKFEMLKECVLDDDARRVSISVGVAVMMPEYENTQNIPATIEQLTKSADKQLYMEKEARKNGAPRKTSSRFARSFEARAPAAV